MTIRKIANYYCSDIIIGPKENEDDDIFIIQGEDVIIIQSDELSDVIKILEEIKNESE